MFDFWDQLGVFIFAVSGALAGRAKGMDHFGMFVIGLITATGGGTLRSVLIGDTPPAILQSPNSLLLAIAATVFASVGAPLWNRIKRVISIFDAFGLGLFTCLGIRVAQNHDMAWWALIVLGVISGTFGGDLRDLLRLKVPLIFRREIYATAAIIGGFILLGLDDLGVASPAAIAIATLSIATIRILAIRSIIPRVDKNPFFAQRTPVMWIGRLALLLALFSLSGMDRAFVQGYAWFTMIQDRSTEMGVEAAIQETMSGEHPCQICEAIVENSYRSPGDSPLRESCEKLVKLYSPWLATNKLQATPPNGIGQLIPAPVSEKRSIYIELPTPPPRWV